MKARKKAQTSAAGEHLTFKDYYGSSAMIAVEGVTASLMQSFFLLYLTDYSGLGTWAASLGSSILVFARIFDAVNDPLEAMIMDRAKPTKWGKYRPFVFLSIILEAIGVIMLFSIPGVENKFVVAIWIIVFYLMYDIGTAFMNSELIYRSMTQDDKQRGTLTVGPRMVTMAAGILVSCIISIVAAVNVKIGNLHTSFSITVAVMVIACAIVAITGILNVHEKYIQENDEEEKTRLTDILDILKTNKAVRVRVGATVFSGFIYNCLFATSTYYAKWAYCADLTTGEVDTALYGTFVLLISMMMFSPLILGTIIANPLMKKFGSAVKLTRFDLLLEGIPCGVLVVLQFTGILPNTPVPFFICMAIVCVFMGCDYVPSAVLNMEIMDYDRYVSGKSRAATVGSIGRLLNKAQTAFATAAVAFVLTAVGYVVDSETDTYLGDLSLMPALLNWFIVIMALIPFLFALIAWFILGKYPITDEIRAKMQIAKADETNGGASAQAGGSAADTGAPGEGGPNREE